MPNDTFLRHAPVFAFKIELMLKKFPTVHESLDRMYRVAKMQKKEQQGRDSERVLFWMVLEAQYYDQS